MCALIASYVSARKNAVAQTQQYLRASAAEQATTLQTLLNGQLETLNTLGAGFMSGDTSDWRRIVARLAEFRPKSGFVRVCYSEPDGTSIWTTGRRWTFPTGSISRTP